MTTVTIEPESKLANAPRKAASSGEAVIIRVGDASYAMNIAREFSEEESLEQLSEEGVAFRAAVDAAFGTWEDSYAEAFQNYIRERRKSGSRPSREL